MKRIKLPAIFLPVLIAAVLFTGLSLASCKAGSCEVRVTAGKVDCDGTNCPSPKRCVLQQRRKDSEDPWKDEGQPAVKDTTMEYRCLCRN